MSPGFVHRKWSKKLLGKTYYKVHSHMDAPSKGLLKWRHRVLRHNLLFHPFYYAVKHRDVKAGLACVQHVIQDYWNKFLLLLVVLLLADKIGLSKPIIYLTLSYLVSISVLALLFEIGWEILNLPVKIFKKLFFD